MSRVAAINCVYVYWRYSWPHPTPEAIPGKVAIFKLFSIFQLGFKSSSILQSILKISSDPIYFCILKIFKKNYFFYF